MLVLKDLNFEFILFFFCFYKGLIDHKLSFAKCMRCTNFNGGNHIFYFDLAVNRYYYLQKKENKFFVYLL
jgi:hypothetical protein